MFRWTAASVLLSSAMLAVVLFQVWRDAHLSSLAKASAFRAFQAELAQNLTDISLNMQAMEQRRKSSDFLIGVARPTVEACKHLVFSEGVGVLAGGLDEYAVILRYIYSLKRLNEKLGERPSPSNGDSQDNDAYFRKLYGHHKDARADTEDLLRTVKSLYGKKYGLPALRVPVPGSTPFIP